MKKYYLLLMSLFHFFYANAQVTVNIPASADNTIYQMPNGSSNALGENLFSGTNGAGSTRRCLIKFDIAAAIPAGALITNVMLTLNCNTSRAVADDVTLHKLLSNWGEGTSNAGAAGDGAGVAATTNDATWLSNFFSVSNWTTAGGDFTAAASAAQSVNAIGFYTWNSAGMLPDVQAWLDAPLTNHGWIIRCNEGTPSTARKFASRENSTAANRPILTVTYTTALPVTLNYFKAIEKNGSALLKWETFSEINNRYFKIMHSTNGSSFSQVGIANSAGNTTSVQQYEFLHRGITAGIHYYKLIQQDLDGREQYSHIEKVLVAQKAAYISVSPNPAASHLTVTGLSTMDNSFYSITNPQGQLVQKNKTTPFIIIQHLPAGVYQISFYKGNELIETKRFVKQ